ncbi:MAG: hypothetical protein K2K16_02730 [Ruminococcus sp.]|nr:hypothetical protein [Ruminococcus sp.]
MQKMLIVSSLYNEYGNLLGGNGLDKLNKYLAEGWKVVNMKESGTIDKADYVLHVCYVVIEK